MNLELYYNNVFKRIIYFGVYIGDVLQKNDPATYNERVRSLLEETGQGFLAKADALSSLGLSESAVDYYRKATDHLHFAQFLYPSERRIALQQSLRTSFSRHLVLLRPLGYFEVNIKSGPSALRGFGASDPRNVSTVIFIGGLDSSKEVELYYFSREFLKRGFNVICVDFPGQGEAADDGCFSHDFDGAFASVAQWALDQFPQNKQMGVFGVSLGGHYALRAAHLSENLRFAISLGGFYDAEPFSKLREEARPGLNRAVFGHANPTKEELSGVNLARLGPYAGPPILYVNGSEDYLVDETQIQMIREHFQPIETVILDGAEHVGTSRFSHVLPYIADWAQCICAGADASSLRKAYALETQRA